MNRTRFQTAEIVSDVVGESRLADRIVEILAAARVTDEIPTAGAHATPADITLLVGGEVPDVAAERSERTRRMPYRFDTAVASDTIRYRMSAFQGRALYTVDLFGLPHRTATWTATAIIPDLGRLRWLPPVLVRAATHEHANMTNYFATMAINEVLEPLVWTKLLASDRTFLHAAAGVAPDGRGIAFTGVGQVGKTSIALGLVRRHGWRYLADDRVIIGVDGMQRIPRPIRLAAHHLAILDDVAHVDGMSMNARPSRSRRPVPITDVIGTERLASCSPLDVVVNVSATPATTELRIRQLSRADLVARVTAQIIGEFWEFLSFMNSAAALSSSAAPASTWHQRVAAVVETALPPDVLGLDVPIGHDLNEVAAFVAKTV